MKQLTNNKYFTNLKSQFVISRTEKEREKISNINPLKLNIMANCNCSCKKQQVNPQKPTTIGKTKVEEGVGPKPGSPLND